MRAVIVYWVDASTDDSSWEAIKCAEKLKPCTCKTYGEICDEDAGCITVVQTVSGDQMVGRITIPKGCITDIKDI